MKGKKVNLSTCIAPCMVQTARAWITQLLTCKEHHACPCFVSVHQMAPPLNVMAYI